MLDDPLTHPHPIAELIRTRCPAIALSVQSDGKPERCYHRRVRHAGEGLLFSISNEA
jgi:hypothetical protein